MEKRKAYLFVETPFSLKNRRTLLFVLMLLALLASTVFAIAVMCSIGDYDTARQMALFLGLWIVCLCVPANLFILLSYITVDDGILVCKYAGLITRRIPRESIDRVSMEQGKIMLYSKRTQVLTVLDCNEARKVLELAHIQEIK